MSIDFSMCPMPRLIVAALAVIATFVPIRAQAQDTFKQTVVVTAAAAPVTLGSVTRTLTIITRDQIAQLPVHTVADVLRLTASVDVRARGDRGVQTDFAIRGANFGQMLVLVDGVRLNDAQSGHHNGDIPVPLDAIERIEVLHGAGSSLFGADAFGGTVNVITRRDVAPASVTVHGGSFGFVSGRGQVGLARGSVRQTFAADAGRSDGFMFERGYDSTGFSSRTVVAERTDLFVSYLRKDFGANNFYGNAPSHEWTNQAMVSAGHRFGVRRGWDLSSDAAYRTHGDHFLFNVLTPGLFENRHRTHAVLGSVKATRRMSDGGSMTLGVEGGGDWIRSTNLGDHTTGRISGFGEWRQAVGPRTQLDASLRVDQYSEFGTSVNPSVGAGWWARPAIRLRASVARAFRVPTFTERFYQDPANWARPEVHAESAWAGETGTDVVLGDGWTATATLFGRLEHDVIDWLRPTTADRWRTYNIRDVDTVGVEFGVGKTLSGGSFVQVQYTGLDVRADTVSQLSKYVLDFAPHAFTAAAVVPLPAGVRLAPRVEYKKRQRSTGVSDYTLFDVRLSRPAGPVELFVEGTNLFDASYQEVLNVAMPGRAGSIGLTLRAR